MDHVFDKGRFIDTINEIAHYREEERGLTFFVRQKSQEIKELKGKISEIENDLITAFFITKAKKEKKKKEISVLNEKIEAAQNEIESVEEKIKELKIRCFGLEKIPSVCFGRYKQGANEELLPLEWDVLVKKNNNILLTTKYVIEHMSYAEKSKYAPWKTSLIRKWLNSDFYNESFSEEEKQLILEKENANPGNDDYRTPSSENTRDKIFLPSVSEVKRFTDYDEDRIASASEYAKKRGVYENEETHGSYWWLRSNGGNMYNASVVNFKGYVFEYGFYVDSTRYGVRPCVWVKTK